VRRAAALIAILLSTATVSADPVTLAFADGVSIRIEIDIDGQTAGQGWHAFLDRLFRHFDRNGDGKLDAAEVARMFPLPLPGRKTLAMNFAAMDADKDGAVSLGELKKYCAKGGFAPVVAVFEPATVDDARLAKLFTMELDTNRDGKLSAAELARFPTLLDKYDRNDDERLRLDDLLAAAPTGPFPTASEPGVGLAKPGSEADAVVRLRFGKTTAASLEARRDSGVSLVADAEGLHRLHGPGGSWIAGLTPHRRLPDMQIVREFMLVQFDTARGERPALTLADIDDDAALGGFRALFPFADRDGDGRLTRNELQDHLDLIELGVRAQVWLTIRDHGRNPFPILDADGDGKLDVREVRRAPAVLPVDRPLPRCVRLSVVGPMTAALGGIALPALRPVVRSAKKSSPPAWFVAMDRNGDGWISPREFLGPPELFRALDTDGDGLISPEEAARKR
jgi:Ca2+-binding EF-hand superfamily protein